MTTTTDDTAHPSAPLIGKAAAGNAPAPSAPAGEQLFDARRKAAIDHHRKTLSSAILALRGLGDHEGLIASLSMELEEIVAEACALAERGASSKAGHPLRDHPSAPAARPQLVPSPAHRPEDVH